jgi:hypothetical protein
VHIFVLIVVVPQPGFIDRLFRCIVDPHPACAAREDGTMVNTLRGRERSRSAKEGGGGRIGLTLNESYLAVSFLFLVLFHHISIRFIVIVIVIVIFVVVVVIVFFLMFNAASCALSLLFTGRFRFGRALRTPLRTRFASVIMEYELVGPRAIAKRKMSR